MSHELKTPITVVGGFAESLLDDALSSELRRRFAETILPNTRRMQRLVDDLLDLSRIESGGWTPNPGRLDLRSSAVEALSSIRERAEPRGVRVELDLAPDAGVVLADPTALRQILANLADNAVRHTTHGTVTVFTRRRGESIEFGVRDPGSGIAPEHLGRIFERFYEFGSSRIRISAPR